MTAAVEARDLDRRIRDGWQSVATSIASLQRLIAEARSAEVWRELGFASWTAYVADVTSAQPVRLEREQRRELVAMLTAEGMSTRIIGEALGVSHPTVISDRRAGGQDLPAAPASKVTGRDGKTYPRPVRDDLAAKRAADQAVADFPELAHYTDTGRDADAVRLAGALRGYDEPERSVRRQALAHTIAAEKRPQQAAAPEPDHLALSMAMQMACNQLAQQITKLGGAETIVRGRERAAPGDADFWRAEFSHLAGLASSLADAAAPIKGLRVVK